MCAEKDTITQPQPLRLAEVIARGGYTVRTDAPSFFFPFVFSNSKMKKRANSNLVPKFQLLSFPVGSDKLHVILNTNTRGQDKLNVRKKNRKS